MCSFVKTMGLSIWQAGCGSVSGWCSSFSSQWPLREASWFALSPVSLRRSSPSSSPLFSSTRPSPNWSRRGHRSQVSNEQGLGLYDERAALSSTLKIIYGLIHKNRQHDCFENCHFVLYINWSSVFLKSGLKGYYRGNLVSLWCKVLVFLLYFTNWDVSDRFKNVIKNNQPNGEWNKRCGAEPHFVFALILSRSFRSILFRTVTMETTQYLHLCATTLQLPGILGRLLENQTQLCCHLSSWREHISLRSTCASSRTAPSSPAGSVHISTSTGTYGYECLQVQV